MFIGLLEEGGCTPVFVVVAGAGFPLQNGPIQLAYLTQEELTRTASL